MTEGTEVEERVDFDEENYMEEMDDDVEEQIDDDGVNDADVEEDLEEEEGDKDGSPEVDRSQVDDELVENEEKQTTLVNEEEKEKHEELLSLPPCGSEVFIGGLPKDIIEEDLRDLCEPVGEIFEIKITKDRDTGDSKGYAFVTFKTKDIAQKAIEGLHSKDFKGKTIRCTISETKNRLFIGNVPKSLSEDEFRKTVQGVGPGVETIELIRDPQGQSRNRGFAFILYYNHACADYSRQKMLSPSFNLDGNTPTVTWADPKGTPDHSAAAAQVKALYVKNIPENTTTEQLKELFQRHGEITKAVMPPGKAGKRDFAFIHFAERSSALKAVKDVEKYKLDGQMLEVAMAKPQSDRKSDGAYPYNTGVHPGHLPNPGYGGFGNPYAAYGVSPSFQQPVIYGRGPMPTGMQMMPMVLPDGRIGYVLQQPGLQMSQSRPRRGDSQNGQQGRGGGSSGGGDDGNRGRRYRPY